jgi:hypothetical protein
MTSRHKVGAWFIKEILTEYTILDKDPANIQLIIPWTITQTLSDNVVCALKEGNGRICERIKQ